MRTATLLRDAITFGNEQIKEGSTVTILRDNHINQDWCDIQFNDIVLYGVKKEFLHMHSDTRPIERDTYDLREHVFTFTNDMPTYSPYEVDKALKEIETMSHFEMCRLWRFQPSGSEIYFRSDLDTAEYFKTRLFQHFGGFTSDISKSLGH